MRNSKKLPQCLLIFTFIIFVTACKKMDSTYREFIVKGGLIYPEKADGAVAFSGHNRVKIQWMRGSDPSVVKARIYWNNYMDSVEVDIGDSNEDTISAIINDLPERSYSFFIKTYDKKGNVSVPVEVMTSVYGDNYQASLLSRPVDLSILYANEAKVTIHWGAANISGGAFATEVKYTDITGKIKTKLFPVSESTSTILDIMSDSSFFYRTLYIPDSLSIDTFYTDFQVNKQYFFNKLNWEVVDFSTQHPGRQNKVTHLIDGDPATRWVTWVGHSHYPHFAIIDMKSLHTITAFELFRVTDGFTDRAPDTFQLLVSTDKNNWVSLGTFNFNRFTNDAQFYDISNHPRARYFKFVGLSGPLDYMAMGEINVYGL